MGIITKTPIPRGRLLRALRPTAALVVILTAAVAAQAQEPQPIAPADWPTYNRDLAGTRHSPLTQIDRSNVGSLRMTSSIP